MRFLLSVPVLLLALAAPGTLRAAQSYDNCTGFIDSLPVTISTQGTWCLRKDVSTAITAGRAIIIEANNVTLDCNHFKIGGLAAGPATAALGIHAPGSNNLTVRNCNVRGFRIGLFLEGNGHLVENNRLDANTIWAMRLSGDHNTVRDNFVYDTGGRPDSLDAAGIVMFGLHARALDNVVSGVYNTLPDGAINGIYLQSGRAERNEINALAADGAGASIVALYTADGGTLRGNVITPPAGTAGEKVGINGGGEAVSLCQGNLVRGYAVALKDCTLVGDNASLP